VRVVSGRIKLYSFFDTRPRHSCFERTWFHFALLLGNVGLQATNVWGLMQHPDIGRISLFVHEGLTCVDNSYNTA
jgi:hypothetical protein